MKQIVAIALISGSIQGIQLRGNFASGMSEEEIAQHHILEKWVELPDCTGAAG